MAGLFAYAPAHAQGAPAQAQGALEAAQTQPRITTEIVRDTLTFVVYFRQGYGVIDRSYMGNDALLNKLDSTWRAIQKDDSSEIVSVSITGICSPEGLYDFNQKLSAKRANAVKNYLKGSVGADDKLFTLNAGGINWRGLRDAITSRDDVPHRAEILFIIDNVPELTYKQADGKPRESRKLQLIYLNDGKDWKYMLEHIYPALRTGTANVALVVEKTVELPAEEPEELPEPEEPVVEPPLPPEELPVPQDSVVAKARKPWLALKTNLLSDAAAIPHIGAEVCLGDKMSLSAEWHYAWWNSDPGHIWWSTYGGNASLRWWLGKRSADNRLSGHHIGIYGQMLTFDFETGGRGYLAADWNYAAGIEYGWSLPVGKALNLDFNIGAGYINGSCKEYLPLDGHYVYQKTDVFPRFGVSKAEIALVWVIGRGASKKGGAR